MEKIYNVREREREKLPDPTSLEHSNQTQKLKRREASAQPSTKQHGSFHGQILKVGFHCFCHMGPFLQHPSAQWPPCLGQKGAYGKDGSVPASTRRGLAFSEFCWGQPGASWSFWGSKGLADKERWCGKIGEE